MSTSDDGLDPACVASILGAPPTGYTLGATRFAREVVASTPDRVIVARFGADGPTGVDALVRVLTADGRSREVRVSTDGLVGVDSARRSDDAVADCSGWT